MASSEQNNTTNNLVSEQCRTTFYANKDLKHLNQIIKWKTAGARERNYKLLKTSKG